MIGSHIDTVKNGGIYDGNLGVLAGLEVIHTFNDANIQTKRPIQVAIFTNDKAEKEVIAVAQEVAKRENVQLEYKFLARFDPIYFDDGMINRVEKKCPKKRSLNFTHAKWGWS